MTKRLDESDEDYRERMRAKMRRRYAEVPGVAERQRRYSAARYARVRGTWGCWIPRAVQGAKERAAEKSLPFDLRPEDVKAETHCPVFLTPLRFATGKASDSSPTLDRVEPSKGYVPGNVRVISRRANVLKGAATLDELKAIVRYMEEHECLS